MNEVVVRACAKINLGLNVLRKRPDGYHDIRSVFAAIDLHDVVHIAPWPTLELVCHPQMTHRSEDNLAYRAAQALIAMYPSSNQGAKITVQKHIPAGAGLGGGSSDAAAVLVGLQRLFGIQLPVNELHDIATSLGSDVPFFLTGGIALVQGRGENVQSLGITLPDVIVVVVPPIHTSTVNAYARLRLKEEPTSNALAQYVDNLDTYGDYVTNDFEDQLFAEHPIMADVKTRLLAMGARYASMSGSGSSIFGLFTSVDNTKKITAQFPDMAVYFCRVVTPEFQTNHS